MAVDEPAKSDRFWPTATAFLALWSSSSLFTNLWLVDWKDVLINQKVI